LEEGYALRIRFAEGSFGTNKFAEVSRIDFIEREKPYDESILEKIPSLDDILEILSYHTIEAMFFGNMSPDEDEDEDEEYDDEDLKKKKKRKVEEDEYLDDDMEEEEDEDEDEDIDDDEDDEEEEEEEDDEEDEDIDEDDEEEDDKKKAKKSPPKRQKPKAKAKAKKCPYGHEFGVDNDSYDDCDNCEVWEKCLEASEE